MGGRDDSSIYIKMKHKAALEVSNAFVSGGIIFPTLLLQAGIEFTHETLPESISQAELLRHVKRLNGNPNIHGILVQMPLPSHIDDAAIVAAIDYRKDVDG